MNVYAVIILTTLLLGYVVNLIADLLNLHALRPELPTAFQGVYDARAYRTSQAYTRVQTQFGWVTGTFMLAITLVFWFAGGFNLVDRAVRGWELGPTWTALAYIGILMLGRALLSLPFRVYATFVLEERFGFNRTTGSTFVIDRLKELGLAVVVGGPLLAGVLAFLTYAGASAWLYCWIATSLFTLGLQFVAPTWIMPLFNTFQPLELGTLKEAILAYARTVNFPLKDVFIMDGSRRSSKSNAFFTGFGKYKRIALFDTLIEQLTPAELVAVLAHEIGHYKKKHIMQGMLLSIVHMGVVFFLLSIFITHQGLFHAFYVEQPSVYTGLIVFALLYSPVDMLLSLGMGLFSRKHEYDADRFAIDTIDKPAAMAQALQKLSLQNLSNLTPHPFYVFLNYSHPPVLARLQAIHSTVAGMAK
ncbi:Protease HtpX [Candidatus Entotheonellaceae bacterium PAL068K]